jgi:integrase
MARTFRKSSYGQIRFRPARKKENKAAYFLRIVIGKRRREFRLGSADELPTLKSREDAADDLRLRLGVARSNATASNVTLERFAEHWYLTVARGRLRPSTAADYEWRFEHYIKGRREAGLPLRQYITRDVQNLINGIAADHPKLSKASFQRIKALLSGIFRHAKVAGFRSDNPVHETFLPPGSPERKREPGVYDLATVRAVLARKMPAELKAAVAIAAYAGLRLAELRGLTWDDYDGKAIVVRRTRWKEHENAPKSKASAAAVPVVPALAAILDEYRASWSPSKKPRRDEEGIEHRDTALFSSELVAFGRYHLPDAFDAVKSEWRGWHAFRRGLASTLFELGAEDVVVQRILRHARVIVTRESYIRRFDRRVEDAMDAFGRAARNGGGTGAAKRRKVINPQ